MRLSETSEVLSSLRTMLQNPPQWTSPHNHKAWTTFPTSVPFIILYEGVKITISFQEVQGDPYILQLNKAQFKAPGKILLQLPILSRDN